VARLHYLKDSDLSWKRIKKGTGFAFVKGNGQAVSEQSRKRIDGLKIPPAWSDVLISDDPYSHIQAMGTDARGRKQYIYHQDWVKKNQEKKFDEMIMFGECLPTLREVVRGHMREHTLSQNRLIATVVWLLEHSFIRVGNKTYAKENQSYGLTTMRNKHVDVRGNRVRFSFRGKSGVDHELDISDPIVAKTIKACIELPGYELFQYVDEDGERHVVDSADVNHYLQTHTGADFSAKDFRTWGGSVLAGDSLYQKGNAQDPAILKKNVADVVAEVSTHLGNTKKVCRTYYIHPAVINSYEKNILVPHFDKAYKRKYSKKFRLSPEEYATWSLIKDS
jgi:DNA topoisomerase-1